MWWINTPNFDVYDDNWNIDDKKWDKQTEYLRKAVESTDIDIKNLYASQLSTIQNCFKEAFWGYTELIPVNNWFMQDLASFMRALNKYNTFKWPKEGDEWKLIKENAIAFWEWLVSYIHGYGSKAMDKMEAEISQDEIEDEIDLSLKLIRERIIYVPLEWEK